MSSYVVDTNILIDIKKIMCNQYDFNKNRDAQYYSDFVEFLTSGEVEVFVTPTVLSEVKKGSYKEDFLLERFINRFCTICEFNDEENVLIEKLYADYIDGENPVIPTIKDIGNRIKYNSNDARVLAEATVLYNSKRFNVIKFITKNIGDFINVNAINKVNEKYDLKTIPFNSMKATNVKKERR